MALLGLMVAAGGSFIYLTRGTTFYLADELYFYAGNRGFDLQYLLTPHFGQLILGPRLIYATVFSLFGPDYLVLRLVELAGVLAVAALVYALAKPRVGRAIALAPAALMLFFGSAFSITLSALGIINVYCLAAGLGAMLVLERRRRGSDAIALVLLAVSLSFWSAGLAFAAGAAVQIVRQGAWRRRAWIVLVPLALYVLWWVAKPGLAGPLYPAAAGVKPANVLLVPNFAADAFAAVAAAVTGLDYGFGQLARDSAWGPALAVVALAACAIALRRQPVRAWPWEWLAVLLIFWALTALTAFAPANRVPDTDRYLYVGAAVTLVVASALVPRLSPSATLLLVAATVVALGANIELMRNGGAQLRTWAASVRADFAAIEIARPVVSPTFVSSAGTIGIPFLYAATNAGTYLAAVHREGSFADTLPELRDAPEADREEADQILAQALGLHLAPASPSPGRSCRAIGDRTFRLPRGGAVLVGQHGTRVMLRRFADSYTAALGTLRPGQAQELRIPGDRAPDPWLAQAVPSVPLRICGLSRGAGS